MRQSPGARGDGEGPVLHIIKLCVGVDSVEDLIAWRAAHPRGDGETANRHVTRMWPKRAAELLAGGSLYWVIRGQVQARQRLIRLDEVIAPDGTRRCGIVMDAELIRTAPVPRRPFQGWRYLEPGDAPPDLPMRRAGDDALPPALQAELSDIGLL